MVQMSLSTKQTHRCEQTCVCQGIGGGKEELGVWDEQM